MKDTLDRAMRSISIGDLLVVGLPFALYLVAASSLWDWLIDDAGITYAYARSLAQGHGLVSQPGMAPVEGYSNLLWLLLMVPWFWLGAFDPYLTGKLLSYGFVLVTFVLAHRIMMRLTGGVRAASAVVLLLVAFNTSFVAWTASGLENPLFVALILGLVLACLRYLEGEPVGKWFAPGMALLVVAIALTRPDGVVYAAVFPLSIVLGEQGSRGRDLRARASDLLTYLGAAVLVYGGFLAFRLLYFGEWWPNTYYAKGGPESDAIVPALTLEGIFLDKFHSLFSSLLGERLWVLPVIVVLVGTTAALIHGLRRRAIVLVLAVTFVAYYVHLIMPNDWMGEFRFASPFFVFIYVLGATVVTISLRELWRSRRARVIAASALIVVVGTAAVNEHRDRLARFAQAPPADFGKVAENYAFWFNELADRLDLDNASVLLPDVGAALYYSDLRVYDLGRLTDRTIARTLYKKQGEFYNYVFEDIQPTFIHTHGSWTNRAALEDDPRFRRDYIAIREWPDKWVKQFNGRDLMSGDYVRRDAVNGREDLLSRIDEPGVEPSGRARADDTLTFADARREPQGFVALRGQSLPNTRVNVEYAIGYHGTLDADSIEMIEYGGGLHYQPVEMAHRCYHFLGAYLVTKDPGLLVRTGKYIRKMEDLAVTVGDASYIPYSFDKRVHRNRKIVLQAPWYSGMAQGEALGVTMRLWELTGDERYRRFGDRLFNSLVHTRADGDPWVSRVDSNGYFWIEEFPDEKQPGMTLNGYMAALYGVYDYYRLTQKDSAQALYEACLTTLKHYLPEFRRPGEYSYYCLGHREPANDSYHHLHISMLNHISRITGDAVFRQAADDFLSDSGPRKTGE